MFHHLNGIVTDLSPNNVVIECSGIGFNVIATSNTALRLKSGEKVKLYISENIREDAFDLYGFIDERERYCFEMLIGVSGVGPKAAMSILSVTTPETFSMAIINGDEKALTKAPGIGKKIAQRILLELKDIISKASENAIVGIEQIFLREGDSKKLSDAASALSVLGYSNSEIVLALKGIEIEDMNIEDIIKKSLKKML